MAVITFTSAWEAASDADTDTEYRLDVDRGAPGEFVTLVTQAATLNPDGAVYTPFSATPTAGISADALTLTLPAGSVDGIPANSLIKWDTEAILLGQVASGATDVYTIVQRGVGATLRAAHTVATNVYGLHETYDAGNIDIGSRHVLRSRVYRIQDADISTPREGVSIYPRARRDRRHTVIWGILQDENGVPQTGIPVSLSATADAYIGETGEHILPVPRSYTTDSDGYFEFDAVVSSAVVGTYALALTIGPSPAGGQPLQKALSTIPDRDYVNFEECA